MRYIPSRENKEWNVLKCLGYTGGCCDPKPFALAFSSPCSLKFKSICVSSCDGCGQASSCSPLTTTEVVLVGLQVRTASLEHRILSRQAPQCFQSLCEWVCNMELGLQEKRKPKTLFRDLQTFLAWVLCSGVPPVSLQSKRQHSVNLTSPRSERYVRNLGGFSSGKDDSSHTLQITGVCFVNYLLQWPHNSLPMKSAVSLHAYRSTIDDYRDLYVLTRDPSKIRERIAQSHQNGRRPPYKPFGQTRPVFLLHLVQYLGREHSNFLLCVMRNLPTSRRTSKWQQSYTAWPLKSSASLANSLISLSVSLHSSILR